MDGQRLPTVRLRCPAAPSVKASRVVGHVWTTPVEVTFDDVAAVTPLDPSRLAITEGGHYVITAPDGTTSAQLNFVLLADDLEAPDVLAEALIAHCRSVQLETLARTPEASADAAD